MLIGTSDGGLWVGWEDDGQDPLVEVLELKGWKLFVDPQGEVEPYPRPPNMVSLWLGTVVFTLSRDPHGRLDVACGGGFPGGFAKLFFPFSPGGGRTGPALLGTTSLVGKIFSAGALHMGSENGLVIFRLDREEPRVS